MIKEVLVFNLLYKWKYLIAIAKSKFYKKSENKNIETITYVAREADKEWIFGAKVRKLASKSKLNATTYFHDKLRDLPESDGYYFVFHQYFYRAIRHNPQILQKKNVIMFTHPNFTFSYSRTHVIWCLNKADKVICLNSEVQRELIASGLKPEKTSLIHIASNPDFFYSHERKTGSVGFCSAFGDRKNPEMVYQLVKNMPERHFYLLGKNWEQFEKFHEMEQLSNFTYHNNEDYSKFPDLYSKIDIFVSPSTLEGGPVPVLEAMLSNCIPVASKTGFCPDVITHGENGFLFETDADYKEVMKLIDQASKKTTDVRATALQYSWENAAKKIDELFTQA